MTYKILAVDDNPINLDLIEKSLFDSQYVILRALSGPEALVVAQREQPDLILLDIMMPHMDGFEVCRRLQAEEQTKYIPIVFISAQNEATDKARGLSLGAVDYLTKPFNALELTARIRSHLSNRQNNVQILQKIKNLQDQFLIKGTGAGYPDLEAMDKLWCETYVESDRSMTIAGRTEIISAPATSVFMPFITGADQAIAVSFMGLEKTYTCKVVQLMLRTFIEGYLRGYGSELIKQDEIVRLFESILQNFSPDVYGVGFTFSLALLDRKKRVFSLYSVHQPLPLVFSGQNGFVQISGPPIELQGSYDEFVTTVEMPFGNELLICFFNPLPAPEIRSKLNAMVKDMKWTDHTVVEDNLKRMTSCIPLLKHDQLLGVIHTI